MNVRKKIDRDAPFQKIKQASLITGLSMYCLRNGCKNGTVPHIKSGGVYYINVPALLHALGVPQDQQQDHERAARMGKE